MKKVLGVLVFALILAVCATALADVEINGTNFPDLAFQNVVRGFDKDGDGSLSKEEIGGVAEIICNEREISSLKGVEYFSSLVVLDCSGNRLTSLDVSRNKALSMLSCTSNRLTSLNVSGNTSLVELSCSSNQLMSLDVSNNTALQVLYCDENRLTTMDVRNNTALVGLYCYSNQLEGLNVKMNKALLWLSCSDNRLKSLDVSSNTALTELSCGSNQLKSLNVGSNTALTELSCGSNQLEELYVGKNAMLRDLDCTSNRLTKLDVSNNPALYSLFCASNQLTSLDVSNNADLSVLRCHDNQLQKVDVSRVPALNNLVKNNDARETDGRLVWGNEGSDHEYSLATDRSVSVVTDAFETVDIGKCKVTAIKNQTCTGKAVKPAVTVKYSGKKLAAGTDFTVAYKSNKKIGKASAIITGKGIYTGTKTVTFKIVPAGVRISSLEAGTKQLTVKWAKRSGITGYQIEYSTKKDFSSSKKVTVSKAGTTRKVIKNLKAKKTWYVRIRTYKTVKGVKYYSAWSAVKRVKTK